jgi:hypothetical protein
VLGRLVLLLLQVRRDDYSRGGAFGHSDAHGAVDEVGQLRRDGRHLHVRARDVLEQAQQIDFLLVVAAHGAAGGLTDDRHDRHVVELGVVQAVKQMDRAGPAGGQADSRLTRELGVPDGLERGHFLVPGLDELRAVVGSAERGDDAVDAVAGVAEQMLDVPLAQAFQQVVTYSRCHDQSLSCVSALLDPVLGPRG